MKHTLIFTTGETTCYDPQTRTMCRFVMSSNFGQEWYCVLLGETLFDDASNFLQRSYECKQKFIGE